ncbi:MAG TPA: TIR domain-containing protein [Puia sp.]|nr:TIR domain-containing protein [Puia sp.]
MTKKKVFISFEHDADRALKDLLIGQSRNDGSPFEVIDGSLKEAAPEKEWEERAENKIRTADIIIVLVGATTHHASGVRKEVAIARRLKKKIVQIIGYKDGKHKRVPDAGRLYCWTWDNLKKILR